MLGIGALLGGCLTPTPAVQTSRMLFVVANPVAHGARLAGAVIEALPTGSTIVADRRLAEPVLAGAVDFPSLAPRSLARHVTVDRLRQALRLRRTQPGLPEARSRLYAEYLFLAQAIRFAAASEALDGSAVEFVLVDFDRAAYAAPWVYAAKQARPSVATLVHGTPRQATYLPVLADHILAWGAVQATWFRHHDVQAHVHLVGRPDVAGGQSASRGPRLVVSQSAEVLTATEAERLLERVHTARAEGYEVILRLHPSVSERALDAEWRRIRDAADRVTVGHKAFSDDVGVNDVIVVIESSAAVDALAVGARAEVLADPGRALPADLEALVQASQARREVDREAIVVAIGEESRRRIAAVLNGLIRDR